MVSPSFTSTTWLSVANNGTQRNSTSSNAAISADGRVDTNNSSDIFVGNLQNGTTTRVSVKSDGNQASGSSNNQAISTSGHSVAFQSSASDPVPGYTNNSTNISVRDLQNGTTQVSLASDRTQASGRSSDSSFSSKAAISPSGGFEAVVSDGFNLVAGDTNNSSEMFVGDLQNGTTTRVWVSNDATQANSSLLSKPAISASGRLVGSESTATKLFPTLIKNTTNIKLPSGTSQISVGDLQKGINTEVSVASDGTEANSSASNPAISASLPFVGVVSSASNLVPGDTNNSSDIFVSDLLTGTTTQASLTNDNTQANSRFSTSSFSRSHMSSGQHFVGFQSSAKNLVAGDTKNSPDIFVGDTGGSTVTDIGLVTLGTGANININNNDILSLAGDNTPATLVGVNTTIFDHSNFSATQLRA